MFQLCWGSDLRSGKTIVSILHPLPICLYPVGFIWFISSTVVPMHLFKSTLQPFHFQIIYGWDSLKSDLSVLPFGVPALSMLVVERVFLAWCFQKLKPNQMGQVGHARGGFRGADLTFRVLYFGRVFLQLRTEMLFAACTFSHWNMNIAVVFIPLSLPSFKKQNE